MPGVATDPAGGHRGGLVLAPFRGVRYAPDRVRDLAAVTSPPYDLIDEDAASALMAADPHNVVRLILPRDVAPRDTRGPAARPASPCVGLAEPGPAGHPPANGGYAHAGETLRRWLADGVLVPDRSPALYVFEQSGPDTLQRGLIGALGLRDERDRVVLPHEDVFPGPVRDRLRLMRATGANLEPIFLLYEGGGGAATELIDAVATGEPAQAADRGARAHPAPVLAVRTDDGLTHRLWRVSDPALHARVAADLRDRQALIADGHHRYATYQELRGEHPGPGPWDFGLALLVDAGRYPPRLGAIHRVIPGLAVDEAARRAATAFRVTEAPAGLDAALRALAAGGGQGAAFLLGGDGRNLLVTDPDPAQVERAMPAGSSASWRALDTSVLHRLLIRRIWGIDETEETVRVVHHDPYAAVARARRHAGTAVIVNPLDADDVFAVAAAGERVPRKSTSFGPKPRTGLVLRTFAAG
jgi:uncharacterized protein (DUF1015 family)